LSANLELFACRHDAGAKSPDARHRLIRDDVNRLAELAKRLPDPDVRATFDARWARRLDEAVVSKVAEMKPWLVVKHAEHSAALHKMFVSSADWQLIRTCPAPLLLAKTHGAPAATHVIAAVDPMHEHDKPADLDREILRFAKQLSTASGGNLHVAHMFDPTSAIATSLNGISTMTPQSFATVEEIAKSVEETHRRALEQLLGEVEIERYELHFERGSVRELLPALVRRVDAGFVVLGAVPRGALARMFLGSTAEEVVDRLPCDMVVIKPPDFRAPQLREKRADQLHSGGSR
jgi:universal stress protein E